MMGESPTFQSLYLLYHDELFRFLYSYTRCPDLAKSLLQDVFMKLFEHHTSLAQEQIRPWLYKTAHHTALDDLRSHRRRQSWHQQAKDKGSLPIDYEAGVDPERQMIALEEAEDQAREQARVEQTLETLSSRQALLLRLRFSGLRYQEIADILEVSPSSISQLLVRAKKAFQQAYEAAYQAPKTTRERSQA